MMIAWLTLGFALGGAASMLATGLVFKLAQRFGWLEQPSPRGLHREPTLSRGGVGFVLVSALFLAVVLAMVSLKPMHIAILIGGGLTLALMGFIDDAYPLPILPRLGTQIAITAIAVWILDPLQNWQLETMVGSIAVMALVVGWVWTINLFNFMDGIDGLVATGVVCIGSTAALLAVTNDHLILAAGWATLAGVSSGFLRWNWPPARIFMGDVGSGYLGYVVALLAVLTVQQAATTIWVLLILLSPFVADTGFTLLRRIWRGERWYQAHRQHAYQKLALRWASHLRVTRSFLVLHLVVITPLAGIADVQPAVGPALAVAVYLGLAFAAWRIGAGTPELVGDSR
jgi:Fuc2NAc and GlcNAc transferase